MAEKRHSAKMMTVVPFKHTYYPVMATFEKQGRRTIIATLPYLVNKNDYQIKCGQLFRVKTIVRYAHSKSMDFSIQLEYNQMLLFIIITI